MAEKGKENVKAAETNKAEQTELTAHRKDVGVH